MKRIVNRLFVLTISVTLWSIVGVVCAQEETAEVEKPAAAEATESVESTEEAASESKPADSTPAEADQAEAESEEASEETESGDSAESDEASEEKAAEGDDNESDHPEEHGSGGEHDSHAGGHHDLGHGNASPTLEDPSALNRDLAIYSFVVFLGLLTLLGRFAWPTISEALEAREKRIEGNIAEAENKLEEAKAVMAVHEAKLAGAADQVRELLEEARRDADATIAQAKADAKAEFEAERQRATRDIEQASDAAVRQLAEKTAGLAIDLAGRVVKQDISADRQSEIVREALGRFADSSSN